MVNVSSKLDILEWELIGDESWGANPEGRVRVYEKKWKFYSKDQRYIIEFETSYDLFDPETYKEIGNRQQIGVRWWLELSGILRWLRLLAEKFWCWTTYDKDKNDI